MSRDHELARLQPETYLGEAFLRPLGDLVVLA